MKRLFLPGILIICIANLFGQDFDPWICTFKGRVLSGEVQKVTRGGDLKVEVVNYDADLEVDTSQSYPSRCGEWKWVKDYADFTVEFVSYGGDLKIRYVNHNAGVPESSRNESAGKINSYNCTWRGLSLYGKVKVVENFPDLKVKIVTGFPDLKVQVVDAFPDACGKWQFVESFPDLKIQFVESFEDIRIEFVNAFPGLK
jgi:hypothetical protein